MATLAIFAAERAAKTLVGEPPQTRRTEYCLRPKGLNFGTSCPKEKCWWMGLTVPSSSDVESVSSKISK